MGTIESFLHSSPTQFKDMHFPQAKKKNYNENPVSEVLKI